MRRNVKRVTFWKSWEAACDGFTATLPASFFGHQGRKNRIVLDPAVYSSGYVWRTTYCTSVIHSKEMMGAFFRTSGPEISRRR